jgi:hypothetical protein
MTGQNLTKNSQKSFFRQQKKLTLEVRPTGF